MYSDVCEKMEARLKEKKAEQKTLAIKEDVIRALEDLKEKYDAEDIFEVLEDEKSRFFLHSENKKEEECMTVESIIKDIKINKTDSKRLYEDIVLLLRVAASAIVAEF